MKFRHGEAVIQHRFLGFDTGELGESNVKMFDEDLTVDGVGVAPADGVEPVLRADTPVQVDLQVFLDFGHPCTAHDEWTVRGARFEQVGEAQDWRNPFTGWEAGTAVNLRRVAG